MLPPCNRHCGGGKAEELEKHVPSSVSQLHFTEPTNGVRAARARATRKYKPRRVRSGGASRALFYCLASSPPRPLEPPAWHSSPAQEHPRAPPCFTSAPTEQLRAACPQLARVKKCCVVDIK